jgi:hypothetical protein
LTGDPKKDITIYGEKARFTKENQPSNESKKAGWARSKRNRKLAQLILNRQFVGMISIKTKTGDYQLQDSKFRKVLKEFFGLSENEMNDMSNEAAIMLRMVGQAITLGDTNAAAMMLERAYGKPKELTPFDDPEAEEDGKPNIVIQIVDPSSLPKIKTDEDESDVTGENLPITEG